MLIDTGLVSGPPGHEGAWPSDDRDEGSLRLYRAPGRGWFQGPMVSGPARPRILFVVSSEMTATGFLQGPLLRLSRRFEIGLALDSANPEFLRSLGIDGPTYSIPIHRAIRPWRDFGALWRLIALLRRDRFDAIHSVTPKAGLIAMIAGAIVGVPRRTHTFTGQVWATRTGLARASLKAIDRLIHRLSTFSLVDSPSQRSLLVDQGVLRPEFSGVLGDGSICGVDLDRFSRNPGVGREVRAELALDETDLLFFYLGRITADKGVVDLAHAFRLVHEQHPRARLALVGPEEGATAAQVRSILEPVAASVRWVGYTTAPERYMAAADVFCLPSYREGFGSVLIEAAAAGVPALASRIYGVTDAVEDGQTGLLHPPRDVNEIARLMNSLAADGGLRARLGEAGLVRARARFSADRLCGEWDRYYDGLVAEAAGDPAPAG